MPFYLKEVDIVSDVAEFQSTLIVLCRFCPAASLALRKNQPYIELFRRFLKTESYERHIHDMQSRLEEGGAKTSTFQGNLLNYFMCMWTSRQREKFLEEARHYEAVVVMGCEGAYENVCDVVKSTGCQVFHGMESEGILTAVPKFHWPFSVSLEIARVTPMLYQKKKIWIEKSEHSNPQNLKGEPHDRCLQAPGTEAG